MKKTLMTIALIASAISTAHAGTVGSTSCRRGYLGGFECHSSYNSVGSNSAQTLSVANEEWTPEVDAKWEAFCKPVLHHDSLGVGRYTYAHEGCGLGRTE